MPKKKTKEEFINQSNINHNNKYDYSLVQYINNSTKVKIKCPIHDIFEQTPNVHLYSGCNKCSKKIIHDKLRSSLDDIKIKFNKIHNNKYDYSLVEYINYSTKIKIKCPIHGLFEQTPNNHIHYGCKDCGIISRINKQTYTKDNIIELFIQKHGNKYDYSLINYNNYADKLDIVCNIHGIFKQSAEDHLRTFGCIQCSNLNVSDKLKKLNNQFIADCVNKHGNKYDYSKVNYKNNRNKIIIICKIHGDFLQIPKDHLNGSGCPKCYKRHSKISLEWLNYIQFKYNNKIQHAENDGEFKIPNTRYDADGYCTENNTIYEFHGDIWHGNPKLFNSNDINPVSKISYGELYNNTQKKKQKIIAFGYNYVEIWEYDWRRAIKAVIKIQRLWRKKFKQ